MQNKEELRIVKEACGVRSASGPHMELIWSFLRNVSRSFCLDAVQGSNEERASRRSTTMSERQRTADAAMRQKASQSKEPCSLAGLAGKKVWGLFGVFDELSDSLFGQQLIRNFPAGFRLIQFGLHLFVRILPF